MLRHLVMPALALAPVPAAGCPAALGPGVVLVSGDGAVSQIRALPQPGLFEERVQYDDGSGYRMQGYFGVYTLTTVNFDAVEEDPDSREVSRYDSPPPPPVPGQRIEGLVVQVEMGGAVFQRRYDLFAGPPGALTIGACSYDGFPIELAVNDIDGARMLRLHFLNALGVAVLVGYGDLFDAEVYDLLSIEALPEGAP